MVEVTGPFSTTVMAVAFVCLVGPALAACGDDDDTAMDGGAMRDGSVADGSARDDAQIEDSGPRSDGSTPPPIGIPPHIAEAPSGQWTAIGSNTLRDVAFDYEAAATPDGFRANLQGIMDAWSGGVYAGDRRRLYLNGGGHRDYDGSEWYAFDLYEAVWERVNDPSLYLESDATEGVFPDGAPLPIHTYDTLAYSPITRQLYRMGRGGSSLSHIWSFDPDAGLWMNTGAGVRDPHSGTAAFDPASGRIILAENDAEASGISHLYAFDPSTGEKSVLQMWGPPMRTVGGALDSTAGEMVWCGSGLAVQRIRTTTGETLDTPVGGDMRLHEVAGPGLAYDSTRDRYTGWGAGDTRSLFHLSKSDWTWTVETPTEGETPGTPNVNGVFGRFQYAPEYDVFILATDVDGPVMMYKPADWSPPAP